MKRQVTASLQRRLGAPGQIPTERLHRKVVGDQNTVKPHMATDDILDYDGRNGGGIFGVDSLVDHMGRHRPRHIREFAEGGKIMVFEVLPQGRHQRKLFMAVAGGATMAGNMLEYRGDAAIEKSLTGPAAKERRHFRVVTEGARADNVMGVRLEQVKHRRTVHINTQLRELHGHQAGVEIGRLATFFPVAPGHLPNGPGGGRIAPLWRLQTGHLAPFLIDENGGVRTAHGIAEVAGQCPYLVG